MHAPELSPPVLLRVGPVEVTATIVYSWAASAVLIGLALVVRRGLARRSGAWPVAAEFVVEHLEAVLRDMLRRDPAPYVPLVVTLALFIAAANLLGLVPGMASPTADFAATSALAVVVFAAVPFYGIRACGVVGYLKHYLEPNPLLLPLEIITELSRTLALAVRLFGNIASEELVIAVLLGIAGFLVPVPMMMLAVLTSVIQAYIFSVLAVVYLGAAVRSRESQT